MTVYFTEYLRKLPTALLLKQVQREGKSGVLSEAVYAEIIEDFHSAEKVRKILASLALEDALHLLQIYLSGEEGVAKKHDESAKILLGTLLIYEATTMKGESRFFGFKDLEEYLVPSFIDLCGTTAVDSQGMHLYWSSLDIVVLLDLIRYGGITLKQTGELSKNSVDVFARKSSVGNLLPSLDMQTLFLEALLWGLHREGYVLLHGQSYTLSLEGYRLPSHIESRLPEIIARLHHAPGVGNGSLIECMIREKNAFLPLEVVASTTASRVAVALLRWQNIAQVLEGGIALQTHVPPVISPVMAGHMMPDHTIIIPPEISPGALFKILSVAEIDRVDMIYHAHIDKQKIIKSVSLGVEPSDVYEVLTQWRASDSLLQSVQEWVRSFSQVYIDQGSYLAVESSQVSTIIGLQPLVGLLEPLQGYEIFKIKSGAEAMVKSCLEERGYDYRKPEKAPHRMLAEGAQLPRNSVKTPHVTNFNPQIEDGETQSVNRVGKYGGQPRALSLDEMCKVIRYALLMEEKIILYILGQDQPHILTPEKLRTGDAGHVEGTTAKGEKIQITLQSIEKMGVLS